MTHGREGGTGVDTPTPPPTPALMPPLVPAACGSLTRTLDSGIGTFPPPDYGGVPAKSTPKPRGRPEPLPGAVPARPPAITKVPRKARTLEREVPSAEELLVAGKHRSAPACRPPAPPGPQGHHTGPQGQCPTMLCAGGMQDPTNGAGCAPMLTQGCDGGLAPRQGGGGLLGETLQVSTDTPPPPSPFSLQMLVTMPGSRGASSRARTGPSPMPKPAAPPTPSSALLGGWRGCTVPHW